MTEQIIHYFIIIAKFGWPIILGMTFTSWRFMIEAKSKPYLMLDKDLPFCWRAIATGAGISFLIILVMLVTIDYLYAPGMPTTDPFRTFIVFIVETCNSTLKAMWSKAPFKSIFYFVYCAFGAVVGMGMAIAVESEA